LVMAGLFAGTSLEQPVTCEHCGQADCVCPKDTAGRSCPPSFQHPRVRREKRRGKWNTVIADVHASPASAPLAGAPPVGAASSHGDLKPLLKSLRTKLGSGGGVSDSPAGPEIVIQGDHKDAVVALLKALGYKAKPAGG
jgi:translation initiation factor 1